MFDVAPFHPQIVHFTIALLFVGVIARVLSFFPWELVSRLGNLRADIFLSMGRRDSARAVIEHALTVLPENPRLRARLDSLTKG